MEPQRPLCFVLMPFGKKSDATGLLIDFDAVYRDCIKGAIERVGLEPIRADEELTGGIIHLPMFERLILCKYAVADLTTANANVFYELGVRHAVRPWSTVLLFAGNSRLPFDVALLRALPYAINQSGLLDDVPAVDAALVERLRDVRKAVENGDTPPPDSPIFQLFRDFPKLEESTTVSFHKQVVRTQEIKAAIATARGVGKDALRDLQRDLGKLADYEASVLLDLLLSYRSVEGFQEMIDLVAAMPEILRETSMVREQLALAQNRIGDDSAAEHTLERLLKERGPSSETLGLLGRVYKDRWRKVRDVDQPLERFQARGFLEKSAEAYLRGFEIDPRDPYPGINALTLLDAKEPPDPRRGLLMPVVSYAIERQVAGNPNDYWSHANRVELAVLTGDEAKATVALSAALASFREPWELKSTSSNVRLVCESRERRGEGIDWARLIENVLDHAAERARQDQDRS